jgi:hypothetical protein
MDITMHVQDDPPVASRGAIEKPDEERIALSGSRPMDPAPLVAGLVFAYVGCTNSTLKCVGSDTPLTGPPASRYFDARQRHDTRHDQEWDGCGIFQLYCIQAERITCAQAERTQGEKASACTNSLLDPPNQSISADRNPTTGAIFR